MESGIRFLGARACQESSEAWLCDALSYANPKLEAEAGGRVTGSRFGLFHFLEDATSAVGKGLPGRRDLEARLGSFDKRRADLLLEIVDSPRQRGLLDTDPVRCASDLPFFHDSEQVM